jgi:hypothetical protein
MKYLQRAAFLILTLCAFSLSLQAQKTFTYKAESGGKGNSIESITIVITQVKTGWEVSGVYSGNTSCEIKGSYFPATGRLKARCIFKGTSRPVPDETVDGIKVTGKDALQISVGKSMYFGGVVVAYRDGIKPKDDTTGDGKPKSGACTLAGTWSQDTKGIGTTDWIIEADGTAKEKGIGYAEGKATLNGNVLHIKWWTKTGYTGDYEWTLDTDCASVDGSLQFTAPRKDKLDSTVTKTK